MCGIAGYIAQDPGSIEDAVLDGFCQALERRGPDGAGRWANSDSTVGLAHRRLAILDLSEAGAQPMAAKSGRYVVSFNGEIYNHLLLREELSRIGRAPNWIGGSDTETLLAAIDAWGLVKTVERLNGMFAIALWDEFERKLFLARDRMGEKPLYYTRHRRLFAFASDLSCFRCLPGFDRGLDAESLSMFFEYGNVPAPRSIFRGVRKLEAGAVLAISQRDLGESATTYWQPRPFARGSATPALSTDREVVDEAESLISQAVQSQLISDVRVGAFLSGGVDSSTVVALMQRHSPRPVRTFSVGFVENAYDESAFAAAVARRLRTDHTSLRLTAADAQAIIPELPTAFSEPFADSSQLPMMLVSRLARETVAVALSGDGGDELFGGYNRHLFADQFAEKLVGTPFALRRSLGGGLRRIASERLDRIGAGLQNWLPASLRTTTSGDKLRKVACVVDCGSNQDVYEKLVQVWSADDSIVPSAGQRPPRQTDLSQYLSGDLVEQMQFEDLRFYLPNDILCKVDRSAMYYGLETRVPFLSLPVVEFAQRLDRRYRIRDGVTKWVLRQVLHRHVGKDLIERPKAGFGIPLDDWLRVGLRPWVEDLLSRDSLRRSGVLNAEVIRAALDEHMTMRRNHGHRLWAVLCFQSWFWGNK